MLQNKRVVVLALILATLLSFTAANLLFRGSSIPSVSAVGTVGSIGVYWDANCSQTVNSINWGTLTLGETKQVVVYVRNEGNQPLFLALTTMNWTDESAYTWMHFSWTSQTVKIGTGQTLKVTQHLSVDPNIHPNIPSGDLTISFNLVFNGSDHFQGDINKDGVVNVQDLVIFAVAYGSTPSSPRWNPDADLNNSSKVDTVDLVLLAGNFGKIGT